MTVPAKTKVILYKEIGMHYNLGTWTYYIIVCRLHKYQVHRMKPEPTKVCNTRTV